MQAVRAQEARPPLPRAPRPPPPALRPSPSPPPPFASPPPSPPLSVTASGTHLPHPSRTRTDRVAQPAVWPLNQRAHRPTQPERAFAWDRACRTSPIDPPHLQSALSSRGHPRQRAPPHLHPPRRLPPLPRLPRRVAAPLRRAAPPPPPPARPADLCTRCTPPWSAGGGTR